MASESSKLAKALKKKVFAAANGDVRVEARPTKENVYTKRIRNLITDNAIRVERERRLTNESLFSIEALPHTWGNEDPSSTLADSIAKNCQQQPSHRISFDTHVAIESAKSTIIGVSKKTKEFILTRRKNKHSHEIALKKSVEQLVAELQQAPEPTTITTTETDTFTQPEPTKRIRNRRNSLDPLLILSSVATTTTTTSNSNNNNFQSSLRGGAGEGPSVSERFRTLQKKKHRSLDSIAAAHPTSILGPLPSVAESTLPEAFASQSKKIRTAPKLCRTSFQLEYSVRDVSAMTEAQFNEMTNYEVPEGDIKVDPDDAYRAMIKTQRPSFATRASLEAIPCLQSESAILIRAEEKEKRRNDVLAKHEQLVKDEEQAILGLMESRKLRQEEKRIHREAETRRKLWAQVVAVAQVQTFIRRQLPQFLADQRKAHAEHVAVCKIGRWYRARKNIRHARLEMTFLKNFRYTKPLWMRVALRWKRSLSARRISIFLTACTKVQLRGFSPIFIRRFILKVKLVQRHIRSFLVCRRARVEALTLKWERVEGAFIRKMFAEAESRRRRGIVAASSVAGSMMKWQSSSRGKPSLAAAAALAALAAQAELKARQDRARISKWSELESRIESFIERLDGKLTDTEVALSYMVADEVKRPVCERWVKDMRKALVNEYSELIRKSFAQMKVVPSYTRDDARRLLRGDERGVLDALKRKLELAACPLEKRKVRESIPRGAFVLYSKLPLTMIEHSVKKAHMDLKTECRGRRLAFSNDS